MPRTPTAPKDWLETIGSLEGQVAFNKAKGSIPARTDADTVGLLGATSRPRSSRSARTPSSPRWRTVPLRPAAWSNAISDAISKFTTGAGDLAGFQSDLADAADGQRLS